MLWFLVFQVLVRTCTTRVSHPDMHHWVQNSLPWPMVCDLSASWNYMLLHPKPLQLLQDNSRGHISSSGQLVSAKGYTNKCAASPVVVRIKHKASYAGYLRVTCSPPEVTGNDLNRLVSQWYTQMGAASNHIG